MTTCVGVGLCVPVYIELSVCMFIIAYMCVCRNMKRSREMRWYVGEDLESRVFCF